MPLSQLRSLEAGTCPRPRQYSLRLRGAVAGRTRRLAPPTPFKLAAARPGLSGPP